MIIWLASYPRSGNTLLRSILKQAFNATTYSEYDDREDIGLIDAVRDQTGHQFMDGGFERFYEKHYRSAELCLVKTHGPPMDSSKAIYIVRDGRSAVVSWFNMLKRLRKRDDVSIADIIVGKGVRFGNWSEHLRQWNPQHRPNTLLLYYSDLVSAPARAIAQLADFIDRPPVAKWSNNFAEMQQAFPEFFHRGSDAANFAQLTAEENALFTQIHGESLKQFGFI